MGKYTTITFPLQRHLAFLKYLFFCVYVIRLGYYMDLVSLLRNRSLHYNKLYVTYH